MSTIYKKKDKLKKTIPKATTHQKEKLQKELNTLNLEEIEGRGKAEELPGAKTTILLDREEGQFTKSQKERDADFLEDSFKKGIRAYKKALVKVSNRLIGEEVYDREIPKGFLIYAWTDTVGFNLAFKTDDGRIFKRAFKISYIVKYDYQGIDRFIFDAVVKMQKLVKERFRKSNIIIPEGIHI